MKAQFRSVCFAVCLLGLAGCAGVTRTPAAVTRSADTQGVSVAKGMRYHVDSANSELHILVYRGGPLARLGHNHVMSSHDVSGYVWIAPMLEQSGFTLRLPVSSIVVDDADARHSEGADFAAEVPEEAQQGTRKNMLSPDVLDADTYPAVEVRATKVIGSLPDVTVTALVSVKNQSREVTVPVTIVSQAEKLVATGEFSIKQSDFGMRPFTVGLGMLQVLDELKIRFKIVATKD